MMPHLLFTDDTTRWTAVQSKDPKADGAFVYAVKTTKIYCRPVCKARLARRSNVSFYSSPAEADRAGYRACKRCKPTALGTMPETRAVKKVRSWALQNRQKSQVGMRHAAGVNTEPLKLSDMATMAGVSKWHFHRICKELSGHTPIRYVEQQNISNDSLNAVWSRSTGGEVELSSGMGFNSRTGQWHDFQPAEDVDADQLNQLIGVFPDNRDFPEICNLPIPWVSSGHDRPEFTWTPDNDTLPSLFGNGIPPADLESGGHCSETAVDHTSTYFFSSYITASVETLDLFEIQPARLDSVPWA